MFGIVEWHYNRVPEGRLGDSLADPSRRGPWRHCEAVELATLRWMHWYSHRRRIEPPGRVPPVEFEAHYSHQRRESAMAA